MSTEVRTRSFPAERGTLAEVRRFVVAELGRSSFSGFAHDLELAVTEACANSIIHSGTSEFRVSILVTGTCLEITIEDDGIYRRTLPVPEIDGQGHRGLHLMAAMVDDFTLRRGTDRSPGTMVRLVKCKV